MQRERRSKSILIVEDSPTTKALIKAIVEEMGDFNTVEAGSGFEALKILPTQEFDLVITDINMPDINGLELISSRPFISGMFISVMTRSNSCVGRIFNASKPEPASTVLKSPISSTMAL